jgi:hypothetical protein
LLAVPLGVFETLFQCREQAENTFTGESNKREYIREHVLVLKSQHYSAGGVKRMNKNQHGRQDETFLARSGTLKNRVSNMPMQSCFQLHAITTRPFKTMRILGLFRDAEEQGFEYAP